jgi:hypothetical protein
VGAKPGRHAEAISSHPLLLKPSARLTRYGGQVRLTISHPYARAAWVRTACHDIAAFFGTLRRTAEQLSHLQCRDRLLSRALPKYHNGRQL